jgi:hypothetical protein
MGNTREIIPQLYSELTVGHPDIIDLAERCELLAQILLDCKTVEQYQPVCRCLIAYLDALKLAFDETLSDLRIIELTVDEIPLKEPNWLVADSDTQYEYCRVTAYSLLHAEDEADAATTAGLLHDLVCFMCDELKAPRFVSAEPQTA